MFDKSISALMAMDLDWGLVGSTVVTGLVVVFLILAVLVFFLWGFGKIFKAINSDGEKRERKKLIERNDSLKSFKLDNGTGQPAAPAVTEVPDTAAEEELEDEDDDEIIAVIAAAIAAYGAAEGKQYRITRVQRPKSARSGWSAAGIAENMRGFMN